MPMIEILSLPLLYYIIITLSFIYAIYRFLVWPYNLDQKYGLSGPNPVPLFGNILEYLSEGFHVCDVENQKKYGHIYPVYLGRMPSLIVSDEAVLRQILVKDSKSFIDRPTIRGLSHIMKKNLLQLKGKDWERVRALVSPTFTSGKLKKMTPMITTSVQYMMELFDSRKDGEVNVKEVFGSLTMTVIARTMFGIELDKNPSNSFVFHAQELLNVTVRNRVFMLLSIFPFLATVLEWIYPSGVVSPTSVEFFEKSLTKTITARKSSNDNEHDFLSLIIRAHEEVIRDQNESTGTNNSIGYKGLTETEIIAQSIVFLLAGYETTASALTFCTYYLAMNEDIQEELYMEIMDHLPRDESISYDMLSELVLVESCLLETLRICPPASRFQRVCTQDTIITTSTGQVLSVKKGLSFTVPVYAIHHDERLWPDHDKFEIHRFDTEEKQKRSQYSFLPFGQGPRTCIGMRFALLEAKLAFVYLLKKYRIKSCESTPKKLTFGPSGLTQVKEPVVVRLEER